MDKVAWFCGLTLSVCVVSGLALLAFVVSGMAFYEEVWVTGWCGAVCGITMAYIGIDITKVIWRLWDEA